MNAGTNAKTTYDNVECTLTAIQNVIDGLQLSSEVDNIDSMASTLQTMSNQLLFKAKEKAVIHMHGGPFTPRVIKKNGRDTTVYRVKHKGKQIESIDYHSFIDKVAQAYGITETEESKDSLTVNHIFESALLEKEETENSSSNTIYRLRHEYDRFINEDLRNRIITDITDVELKKYTQELTLRLNIKAKAFLGYKSLLNLIFNYAVYHDIITKNPVTKIKNKVYLKNCDTSKPKSEEKILSEEEIDLVKAETSRRKAMSKYNGYCVYAYVCELAIETGMRAAELCSLKESDIKGNFIHIHSQQLYELKKGGKHYYQVPYTKDEKGIQQGGRFFPINKAIKDILAENLQAKQSLGLTSEYIFCTRENEWIKTDAYETFLRRMLKSLGLEVTNNHAFRMSLNSNKLIPLGLTPVERAQLLGHSVETNLKHYTYSMKDNLEHLRKVLSGNDYEDDDLVIHGHPNVIPFPTKKESLKSNKLKAF